MRKDPTEFRERFLRWKNGELVYENGLALPAYEDGKWNPNDTYTADARMIKSKLAIASHFGNPTARRMTNYDGRDYTWPGEYEYINGVGEPKRGNVYVGSYDNLVTPQIQDNGKTLEFVDNPWNPKNEQRSYKQSLKFNNMRDAWSFGENYKKYAPMMNRYEDGKLPKYDIGLIPTINDEQVSDNTRVAPTFITQPFTSKQWAEEHGRRQLAKTKDAQFTTDTRGVWLKQKDTKTNQRILAEEQRAKNQENAIKGVESLARITAPSTYVGLMMGNDNGTGTGYVSSDLLTDALALGTPNLLKTGLSAVKYIPKNSLFRRVRNFVYPRYHESPYGRASIPDEYLYPFLREYDRAYYNTNAAIKGHNISILAPFKEDVGKGTFTDVQYPIKIDFPEGTVSGSAYGKRYNAGTQFKVQYGSVGRKKGEEEFRSGRYYAVPDWFKRGGDEYDFEFLTHNDPNVTQALSQHVGDVLKQFGVPVVGSSRLISGGYIGGVPGDIEVVVPKSGLDKLQNALGFLYVRDTKGGTGVTGSSKKVLQGQESNNIDINVLEDTGTIIHQLESTRNPNKMPPLYSANAERNAQAQGTGAYLSNPFRRSAELKIPKVGSNADYTAEEYFNEVANDQNLLDQSVIDNAFKSNSKKHMQRAYTMMNNSDPNVVQKVTTAIDHMNSLIPGMRKFSEIYQNQSFNDISKNKEILEKIGFAPMDADKFASNPQQMKNIVDYWYMRNTVGSRSVNYEARKGASYGDVMSAVRQYDNGSASGGGGNTILGGKFGGYTRDHTSYTQYSPVVDTRTATFDDVYNAFLREKEIWKDRDAVRNAIEETIKEHQLDQHYGIGIEDFYNFDSRFTDDLTRLTNKKIKPEEADFIVTEIARKLGVSGVRGDQYSDLGLYFGGMLKPNYRILKPGEENVHVAYRNIDSPKHNDPILPAEWGTDNMFFGKPSYGDDMVGYANYPVYADDPNALLLFEGAKKYPENITDLRPYIKQYEDYLAKTPVDQQESAWKYYHDLFKVDEKNLAYLNRMKHYDKMYNKLWDVYAKQQRRRNTTKTVTKVGGILSGVGSLLGIMTHSIGESRRRFRLMERHPEILEKVMREYGEDEWTNKHEEAFDNYYKQHIDSLKEVMRKRRKNEAGHQR